MVVPLGLPDRGRGPGRRCPRAPALDGCWPAVVVAALAENAAYFGNPLSFTNAAVQPKRLAYRAARRLQHRLGPEPRADPGLARRAATGTRHASIPSISCPATTPSDLNAAGRRLRLRAAPLGARAPRPGGHLGHTYLWYTSTTTRIDRFLYDTRRLAPDALGATVCPPTRRDYVRAAASGARSPFALRATRRAGRDLGGLRRRPRAAWMSASA